MSLKLFSPWWKPSCRRNIFPGKVSTQSLQSSLKNCSLFPLQSTVTLALLPPHFPFKSLPPSTSFVAPFLASPSLQAFLNSSLVFFNPSSHHHSPPPPWCYPLSLFPHPPPHWAYIAFFEVGRYVNFKILHLFLGYFLQLFIGMVTECRLRWTKFMYKILRLYMETVMGSLSLSFNLIVCFICLPSNHFVNFLFFPFLPILSLIFVYLFQYSSVPLVFIYEYFWYILCCKTNN